MPCGPNSRSAKCDVAQALRQHVAHGLAPPQHSEPRPIGFPDDLRFKSHLTVSPICSTLDRNERTHLAGAVLTADPRSD